MVKHPDNNKKQQQKVKQKQVTKKASFITLCGPSNAGKSTLLNEIVGNKIAAVSKKVQTTRNIIKGIYTQDNTQLIFVDTPGIFRPRTRLEKIITKHAWNQVRESNVNALMLDASKGVTDNVKKIIGHFKDGEHQHVVAVINKIDLVKKHKLLELTAELSELFDFKRIFLISALNNNGVDDIIDYFIDSAEESDFHYPEELVTDISTEFLTAEITREKLFNILHRELPYSLSVETELIEEAEHELKIHQVIYVLKESHKRIILGKKGENIKNIGIESRSDIEKILEKHVNLKLFVKVKEDWLDKPLLYMKT